MKFLLLTVVLWVAWSLWRNQQRRDAAPPQPRRAQPAQALPPVQMVPCAHCGMHVPQSEAVQSDGRSYCSSAHARLGPA